MCFVCMDWSCGPKATPPHYPASAHRQMCVLGGGDCGECWKWAVGAVADHFHVLECRGSTSSTPVCAKMLEEALHQPALTYPSTITRVHTRHGCRDSNSTPGRARTLEEALQAARESLQQGRESAGLTIADPKQLQLGDLYRISEGVFVGTICAWVFVHVWTPSGC